MRRTTTWQEELAKAIFKQVEDQMHEIYYPRARHQLGGGFPMELIHDIPGIYDRLMNLRSLLHGKDANLTISFFESLVENLMDEIEAYVAKT